MRGRVVFLLEEPSMKAFLQELLPRLIPGWQHEEHFLLVPHEGKSDLEKSVPRKLRAWREPGARFVILRDNDNSDCEQLKQRLLGICDGCGREVQIRLVCQELEAWYLADVTALSTAYPDQVRGIQRLVRRYADPDQCAKPSRELEREIPEFQKQDAARRLGRVVSSQRSKSGSFRVFVSGVQRLAGVAV